MLTREELSRQTFSRGDRSVGDNATNDPRTWLLLTGRSRLPVLLNQQASGSGARWQQQGSAQEIPTQLIVNSWALKNAVVTR